MRGHGNGTPQVCTENLLQTIRGEVPYERLKGMDARLVDKPLASASFEAQADAEWLINTYEPRVDVRGIRLKDSDAVGGGFTVVADVTEKG